MAVTLPEPLRWRPSPNHSPRRSSGVHLVVVHRPVGSYEGSIAWLCHPRAQASAHVITEHDQATQLVAWADKAWACEAFNSHSDNIEVDDNAWAAGSDHDAVAFAIAARIVAFRCHVRGIPAVWSRDPRRAGVCRHFDLGALGGGHTDPTEDDALWTLFMGRVAHELHRGGFRTSWGR